MNPIFRAISTAFVLSASSGLSQAPPPAVPAKPGFTLADLKAQIPQDKDGVFLMELTDILNTATDPAVRALLEGQPVATTAQVAIDPQAKADDGHLRLVRSQVQCCAAHLRKCAVVVECSGKVPGFKDQAWVRVVGTLGYRHEDGKSTPCIVAREIKEVPAPADPLIR